METRLYMVNTGNGNDGVGTSWPRFYVRTDDPFVLAAAACISDFTKGEGRDWACEHVEIDGEAEYMVSATLYDPPDDREDYEEELSEAREAVDAAETDEEREEAEAALEELESNDPGSWSEFNGAWMIVEVSACDNDEPHTRAPVFDSLEEAFDADTLERARNA